LIGHGAHVHFSAQSGQGGFQSASDSIANGSLIWTRLAGGRLSRQFIASQPMGLAARNGAGLGV